MDKIENLMAMGYNVHIECKGKGRIYEMTYEATATKVIEEQVVDKNAEPRLEQLVDSLKMYHTVGESLEEIADDLYKQIQNKK